MSVSPTNLHIGIVGAGMIGEVLARHWSKASHTVKISNSRGPDTLADVAKRTGATAATVEDAVDNAHVVVVTIPLNSVPKLDKNLFMSLPKTTIVIDTNNYYPARDGQIAELEGEEAMMESKWVETQLGREVIKVFNNIDAYSLDKRGTDKSSKDRIALPVSGADAIHKQTVIALIDQIGFDAMDAGNIDASWRQQPGTPVYCTNLHVEGVRAALLRADRGKSAAVRDATMARLGPDLAAGKSWETMYSVVREIVDEHYEEK